MLEVDNKHNIDSVIKHNKRTYALFYASWCPFCISFLPIFEECADKKDHDEFIHVKIDDQINPLWEEYCIEVVPTVILFEAEKVSRRLNGIHGTGLSEKELKEFLKIN